MPRPVQGYRIVKPRTPNQQVHIGGYYRSREPDSVTVILPREAGAPTESWWTGKSREEFDRAAAAEQLRMKDSKFGNVTKAIL